MGMRTAGGRRGSIGEMNITPMIDVLLVLLVIFMVMQAGYLTGPELHVPPPDDGTVREPDPASIVLQVGPGGSYRLNRQPVASGRLEETLRAEFAGRTRKVLFVKGDESASYGEVVAAMDASMAAGVEIVGLAPR